MKPELPVELLDYIFTFMHDDRPSLRACASVNPVFSEIVEKHLYYEVSLYNSDILNVKGELNPAQFLKLFTDKPHIASHVRSLRIVISELGLVRWFQARTMNDDDIGLVLPRIPHLVRLCLTARRNGKTSWARLQQVFQTSFTQTLRSPSLVNVSIIGMHDFPLPFLDSCTSLEHLLLSGNFSLKKDGTTDLDPQSLIPNSNQPVRSQLKSLTLRHCAGSVDEILGWLKTESSPDIGSLVCLKVTVQRPEDYSLVPGILEACSSSLIELELDPGSKVHTMYNMNDEIVPSPATLHQLVDLSSIRNLNYLTIVSFLGSVENFWISSNGEETNEDCVYTTPFSWILRLVATLSRFPSNCLKHVVLELSFHINRRSLERVNWGHLTATFNLKLLPSLRKVELKVTSIKTPTVDLPTLMQILRTDLHLSPLIETGLWLLTGKEYQS